MQDHPDLYVYRARVVSVYDGDTVRLDIDLGCRVWLRNESCRLVGIDTPEIRGAERELGLKAKAALVGRLSGGEYLIRTHKDRKGKYGRWLVEIMDGDTSINEWLVEQGYARRYL